MMAGLPFAIVELVALAPPALAARPRPIAEFAFRADAWLPDELARLHELFHADTAIDAISTDLGRTLHAVCTKIYELGLRRNSSRPWSEEEDRLLERDYGAEAASEIAAVLGRSCAAVYARAGILGLTEGSPPRYSAWEDAQITAGYAAGIRIAQIGVLIGRPGSGIVSRASALGLRHRCKAPDWTEAEMQRALELAEQGIVYREIGRRLGAEGFAPRSKVAVERVLHGLGYSRGWGRAWTAEEDELLRAHYRSGQSLTPLIFRLGRSKTSIRWRAGALQLRGTHPRRDGFRQGPVWTDADEGRLREQYGKMDTRALAAALGRPLRAVYSRAHALGLVHGYLKPFNPEEDEAIAIAFRLGFSITDLAEALGRDTTVVSKHAKRDLQIHFSARTTKAPRGPRGARRMLSLAEILSLGRDQDR